VHAVINGLAVPAVRPAQEIDQVVLPAGQTGQDLLFDQSGTERAGDDQAGTDANGRAAGVREAAARLLDGGEGVPGSGGVSFQLPSYERHNNALSLTAAQSSGTMTLATPCKFSQLSFLGTSGWDSQTLTVSLNFTAGDPTTGILFPLGPLYGNGSQVYTAGIVQRDMNTFADWGNLYQTDFVLSPADQARTLQSVTFTAPSTASVYAISGDTVGAPPPATATAVTGNGTSTLGDSVTLTATVTPTPTGGTVQFHDNTTDTDIGTAQSMTGGVATVGTALTVGTHSIIATFSGTTGFFPSVSPAVTHTVSAGPLITIPLTPGSYNHDDVWTNSGTDPFSTVCALSGWSLYQSGVTGGVGMPASGLVPGNGGVSFQLPSYESNNNALTLNGSAGTMTLVAPGQFAQLSFLGMSANGDTLTVSLNFTEGAPTTGILFPIGPPWPGGNGSQVYTAGLCMADRYTFPTWGALYQKDIILSPSDRARTLQSVTFTAPSIDSVYAISGYTVGAPAGSAYEIWASTHAGGQTAEKDYNHDGVSNGIAYFMGMDGLATNPGVVNGKVTWPHVGAVTSFEVQVSDNLQDWSAATTGVDTSDPTKVVYTLPTGAAKKFCRLLVIP